MKIQIVQLEIEEAIRKHILEQITVKDGMEIAIEIRSTRGDAGFTADIDIVPAAPAKNTGSQAKATAPVLTNGPATASVKKESPELPKAEANQGKEDPAPQVQEQAAGSTVSDQNTGSTVQTSTEQTGEQEHAQQQAGSEAGAEPSSTEAQQSAEEAPKPAGRSLFPNLKRVNNG